MKQFLFSWTDSINRQPSHRPFDSVGNHWSTKDHRKAIKLFMRSVMTKERFILWEPFCKSIGKHCMQLLNAMGQGISEQIFKNQQWTRSKEDSQLASIWNNITNNILYIGITNPILGHFDPGPARNDRDD